MYKPNRAEAIYKGQLKEQVKLLKDIDFKPSCVKKIKLRAKTTTLEAIFKEGLINLLNLTEVTVNPDSDACFHSQEKIFQITKNMGPLMVSKLPITKSFWWVIAYMTNPYFMHTMHRQWDPSKEEYIYDTHYFKPDLNTTSYQEKIANTYPTSLKHLDPSIDTNIDKIDFRQINNYTGSDQYVKHADSQNIALFEKQLSNLTGKTFCIIDDYTLEDISDANFLSNEKENDGFFIYPVCSAA